MEDDDHIDTRPLLRQRHDSRRFSNYQRLRQSVASVTSTVLPPDYAAVLLDPDAHYRKVLLQVVHGGLSFALIFTASIVQSFLTTLYPGTVGYISLSLIQFLFAIGGLVVPGICARIGVVNAMFLGAVTYPLLSASINSNNATIVLVASALNGIGAGLLWISQGIWLTRVTMKVGSVGTFTGIFFTLFNLNGIFGNVLTIVLQQVNISFDTIAWTITGLAAAGSISVFFVARTKHEHHHSSAGFVKRFHELIHVGTMKKTLFLTPYICAQGLSLAYSAGNLPVYADGDEKLIAYILLAFGITATITSFVCGKVYDRFGMRPLLVVHVLVVILQYSGIILFVDSIGLPLDSFRDQIGSSAKFATLTLLGASYGLLDYMINSLVNISISKYYDADMMPSGFAYFRFVSCVAYAISAAVSPLVPSSVIIATNILFCFLSVVSYMLFEKTIKEEDEALSPADRMNLLRSRSQIMSQDAMRLSVASIVCVGPARPSVVSAPDIVREEVEELLHDQEESDIGCQ